MGPKASVTYAKITGKAAYRLANGEVSFRNLTATEIKLDAFPLNQYLDNQFSFSDLASLESQKTTLDNLGFTEEQAKAVAKAATDSVGFSDTVSLLLIIERAFADSVAVSDVSVIALDKDITETISLSESQQKAVSLGKADGISISDTYSSVFAKPVTDSFTATDSFGRVATYARSFTDAFGLDELVSVTPNWGVEKTNVLSFTDSFSYEIRAGHNAVLNASALNTYTLNS